MNITEKQLRKILNEQKKTEDIMIDLSAIGVYTNPRSWRDFVRRYNDEFDRHDSYIASDMNGYYLTASKKKITKTAMNKFRNGLSMLKNAKKDLQILADKNQLSLMDDDVSLYDMIVKMEI